MSTANNFSILASAGTGKTYQLSVRIARLLMLDKIEPSQIIALTFTRAAAAEFYLRALERLKEAATDDAKRLQICGVHPKEDPSPVDQDNPLVLDPAKYPKEAFAKKLRELVLKSDRLALGTLDSFFVRLVNQFPLELGLETSHPSIVTDQQGPLLLENAVLRFFEEMGEGESLSQLGQHLTDYSDGKAAANPAETLIKMAKANHELLTLAPSVELWGKAAWIWPKGIPAELSLEGEIPEMGNDLSMVLTALERYPTGTEGSTTRRDQLTKKMECVAGVQRISDIKPEDLQSFLELYGPALKPECDKDFAVTHYEKTINLDEAEIQALRRLLWRLFSMAVRKAIKKTHALHACLTGFERAYDLENRRKGHLTFSDYVILLSAWLAPLARKEEVKQIVEEIQFRLDSQIKHWLLDEFQDTGTRQYDVLRRNIDEIIQQSDGDRSVFVVGDAKQSLYEWRSGNRELLTRLNDLISENGNRADLNQTRRCSPQVLKMVNALLSNLTDRKLGDYFSPISAKDWDSVFKPQVSHQKAPQIGQSLWVRITDEQAKEEPVATQARWIAEDLKRSGVLEDLSTDGNRRLKSGITCAILVGKNDDAADIAEMLRVQGIEATDEASTAVIRDNPVTAGLFAIIEATAHPDNGLARGLAWMSPTARRLLKDDNGRPNWPVTSRKVADLFAAHGAEAVADWLAGTITKEESSEFISKRVRQFRAIAADYDTTGGRDLSEFITFADSTHLRDTADKRSVQVITIHRSKGLEYDMVFMPCLNDRYHKIAEVRGNLLYMTPAMRQKSEAKVNSIYDESLFRPDWILSGMSSAVAQYIPGLKEANEALAGEGGYGSLCRLYVGMTRARIRLVMLSNKLSEDDLKINKKDGERAKTHFEHPSKHGGHDFAKFLESALKDSGEADKEFPKTESTIESEIAWSDSATPSDISWVGACGKKASGAGDKGASVILVPDGSKFVAAIRPSRNKPSSQPNTFEAPWAKTTSELRGKEFGTYVHELFARLERDADGFLAKLSTLTAAEGMETVHATAVERIKACLADKSIRQLLVEDIEGKLLWVERKAIVMNEKGLTPAVFDRVHIVPGKSAIIIDYKTATNRTDAYLKEHYIKQMESYRDAVSRLTGISPENIRAKLIGIQERGVSIVDVL